MRKAARIDLFDRERELSRRLCRVWRRNVGINMDFMELFFKKHDIQASRMTPANKPWHSRSYHKYFEGYSEHYQLDEKGRRKICRVYTGPLYRPQLSQKRRRALLLIRFVLFAAGAALFLIGAFQPAVCNLTFYSAIFQALSVLPVFWSFLGIWAHLSAPGDLKIGEYKRSAVRLRKASAVSAAFLLAGAAAAMLAGFLASSRFDARSGLCAALFFLSAAAFFALNRLEVSVKYDVTEPQADEQKL